VNRPHVNKLGWIQRLKLKRVLPDWTDIDKQNPGFIIIKIDDIFPKIFNHLKVKKNHYWYQIARRCVTTYLKEKLKRPLALRMVGDKNIWAPDKMDSPELASAGADEFRVYYENIKKIL